MSYDYSENILVQESAGHLLADELGWQVELAYNQEVLGENRTFGRSSYKDILLVRYFQKALRTLNPWITDAQVIEAQNTFENEENGDTIPDNINVGKAIKYFEKHLCISDGDLDVVMPKTAYAREYKWFYHKYIEYMLANNVLDFDMLILMTFRLFKENPGIAKIYARTYKYINIDEFQDTNYGQYMLIKCMCGTKNNNLFIVADDDQVIYGWNGASFINIY